jgi:hypothetical protein
MSARSRFVAAGLLSGLFLFGAAASASARWMIQPTVPSLGNVMTGVSCQARMCMAVLGTAGAAGSELYNGHHWSVRSVPDPARGLGPADDLAAISCPSARWCVAVGNYGHVSQELPLAERWNGHRWSVLHIPTRYLAHGGFATLTGVSCTSASACMAVGFRGLLSDGEPSALLAERWNGHRWRAEATRAAGGRGFPGFSAVSCSSAGACTAVGNYSSERTETPLAERWNGHRWSVEHLPATPHAANALSAVSCFSAGACTAVGNHGHRTLIERWNGHRWSAQYGPSAGGAYDSLTGVSCTGPRVCLAVGGSFAGRREVVLAERLNGHRSSLQHPPNQGRQGDALDAVSCSSRGSCTAAGEYGVRTTCNSTQCIQPEPLAERWTRR